MPKKKKEVSGDDIVQSAIQEGMNAIFQHHPQFRGAQEYIANHIDQQRLQHGIGEIQKYIVEKGKNWSPEEKAKFLYQEVANYVASGKAFNDSGKREILKSSLEERAQESRGLSPWGRGKRSNEIKGEEKLDRATKAFTDIYNLMRSGDYAERMPELYQDVGTLYDLGFLETTMEVLDSRGLLEKGQYKAIKKAIDKKREEAVKGYSEHLHKYLEPKKVAAAIVGAAGVALIMTFERGITGAVIGVPRGNTGGVLIGVGLMVLSVILMFRRK